MEKQVGVFCHNGLGDGINCLVLSHNLSLQGWKVDTFQNTLGSMQNWFPHLPVYPYPSLDQIEEILACYEKYFVVQNDTSPFVLKLIEEGKKRFPERMKVIYLYPSKNIVNERYYDDCKTDPTVSVAENLRRLCGGVLSNGFRAPEGLVHRKWAKRVIIHPTSGRVSKNWPKEKYVKLALHLQKQGYEVVFVPGEEGWNIYGIEVQRFTGLNELATYIYESGYLIGNDSGLGHLASALGIPTLVFCRRKTLAKLWAPSFLRGEVVTPGEWIPNVRGLRWRDRYWQKFITVGMATRAFRRLVCRN